MENYKGVMLDCSRNAVMNLPSVKKMILNLEKMGYNCLMLYTEDTYEIDGEPYFGHMRGKYSKEEIRQIDAFAKEHGITLMPCIQTLAHLERIMRWENYSKLVDIDNILCVGEDATYELVDKMFASIADSFSTNIVHVGMDEAAHVGLGKYMQKHGAEKRIDILLKHLDRVSEIAEKYGFQLLMWGDMFLKLLNNGAWYDCKITDKTISERVPKNVKLVYWDYYSGDEQHYLDNIDNYKEIQEDIWFAGGVWTWCGFLPKINTGIDYSRAAVKACHKKGVKNILFTMWGDDGGECSMFSSLPSLYAASQFCEGNFDMENIKAGFKELFGLDFDQVCEIQLPDTESVLRFDGNPEKYALYNDCLQGLFDVKIKADEAEKYAEEAKKLAPLCEGNEYSYVFRTAKSLCEVLAVKYDLSVKTHRAYINGDKAALKELLKDYDKSVELIKQFHKDFEYQWFKDNKPFGFIYQDVRLGGLIFRMEHCKEIIERYISGEIDTIEELDQPRLAVRGADDISGDEVINYNNWYGTVLC